MFDPQKESYKWGYIYSRPSRDLIFPLLNLHEKKNLNYWTIRTLLYYNFFFVGEIFFSTSTFIEKKTASNILCYRLVVPQKFIVSKAIKNKIYIQIFVWIAYKDKLRTVHLKWTGILFETSSIDLNRSVYPFFYLK